MEDWPSPKSQAKVALPVQFAGVAVAWKETGAPASPPAGTVASQARVQVESVVAGNPVLALYEVEVIPVTARPSPMLLTTHLALVEAGAAPLMGSPPAFRLYAFNR